MTNIPQKMSLQHYLSSAQQLLNLAHAQAQQMLSLAYQQAQQVLLNCDQAPQIKPPSLMSVCKAHNHPACSRVPCSQILYNQSKVTCHQLQAELIKRSKRPRTKATKTQSVKQARINELGYPAPQPSTIKRSRSFPTFPPGLEPLMGEGKHPIKPTCVIKTPRTAATSQILTLPKQSMAKPDEGDAAAKEEPILEASFNIKQGSLMAEQPGAPSAPNPPPIPYIGAAALAQGGGPQPTGNHFEPDSVANSHILMSGFCGICQANALPSNHNLHQCRFLPKKYRQVIAQTVRMETGCGNESSGSESCGSESCGSESWESESCESEGCKSEGCGNESCGN